MPALTAATVWFVAGTALALAMLAGCVLFDLGSVRKKNTAGTIVRHLLITAVTVLCFLFMGFGLYFGGTGGVFGVLDFFTLGNYGPALPAGVPLPLFVASQAVVAAVAANIVCGAMAERANLAATVAAGVVVGLVVYPFVNRWTWGAGWLAQLGFHDFAGAASLNVVAGTVALVAAVLLGPRAGKYAADGTARAVPGQSLTRCVEGVLLIWIGWFGVMSVSVPVFGTAGVETLGRAALGLLAGSATAVITCIAISQVRYGCIDVPIALNGLVGGLVAVSSGADAMSPLVCGLAGIAAGAVVLFGIEGIERVAHIDDPVGAIAAHGCCGVLGCVLVALFADGRGLVYGSLTGVIAELAGVVAIVAATAVVAGAVFALVRRTADVRVLASEEEGGLGLSGPSFSNAYAAYLPDLAAHGIAAALDADALPVPDLPVDAAIPLALAGAGSKAPAAGARPHHLYDVRIICRPTRLPELRHELNAIGVTGMTVVSVRGCGEQKGAHETYRGVPVAVDFVPKVLVSLIVSRVPVTAVVMAARRALYTGHIGDGKIFVYDVAEAVKVRTGEHGFDAVQNLEERADRVQPRA